MGVAGVSSDRSIIPLTAHPIQITSPDFLTICSWPFADGFVHRLLRDDIPQRAVQGHCRIFLYNDPGEQPVGFGTLDVCGDYSLITGKPLHPYIPLLGVNPTIKSLGYGTSILNHLTAEAALLIRLSGCADSVFLEVYENSTRARALYDRAGFRPVADEIYDEVEEQPYTVMARRVSTEEGK